MTMSLLLCRSASRLHTHLVRRFSASSTRRRDDSDNRTIPVPIDDADLEHPVPPPESFAVRGSEHTSFDPQFIHQEEWQERARFADLVATYGKHLVARPLPDCPERDFVVSKDPEEWRFVERLLTYDIVPPVPEKDEYPSGYRPPTARPGDHAYFVARTPSHLLPVYADYHAPSKVMQTQVKRADGNLYQLRDDLKAFLADRYRMDFISQVSEVQQKVIFRGDFEKDFKEFLLNKGF